MMCMSEENQKSSVFFQMITLAVSGASGKRIHLSDDIEWQKVIQYAREQGVLPLIGCALLHNPDIYCPEDLREQLIHAVRGESGKNMVRRQRAMQLLARMEADGLDVRLIKGYAVADCYKYPECRDSTDIDIFVYREQESQVYAFLKKQGFQLNPRGRTEHHAVGLHPKLGKVEVHVQLYHELVREVWFREVSREQLVTESPVIVSGDGESYQTLGHTDHLIFLTLHMVKHFIRSGMSVRMMIDVALFFAANKDRIDTEHYWRILKTLHYDTVLCCVFAIMLDTGCFTRPDFPMLPEEKPDGISWIMRDLETGGIMGIKEEKRMLDMYEYTRQMLLRSRKPWQYRLYMLKHKLRSAWHQMFPDREQLEALYPEVKRAGFLRPVFRLHRMFAYPLRKLRSGVLKEQIRTDSAQLPPEAKQRMEMFKVLDMLP